MVILVKFVFIITYVHSFRHPKNIITNGSIYCTYSDSVYQILSKHIHPKL